MIPQEETTQDTTTRLVKRSVRALSSQGPFAQGNPHFRERRSQLAYVREVAQAIRQHRHMIARAGTGTGKTFAYLTPILLSGKRVIISTAGKALQDQLFNKDLPRLTKRLKIYPHVALLKGRNNYLCPLRMAELRARGTFPTREGARYFERIVRYSKVTKTGDRADLHSVPERDPIWLEVTSDREHCPGFERCAYKEQCFLKKARDRARRSQVVVVNHHLLVGLLALESESDGAASVLGKTDVVVIDEAHQLAGQATSFFTQTVSTRDILITLEFLISGMLIYFKEAARWDSLLAEVRKAHAALCDAAKQIGWKEGRSYDVQQRPLHGRLVPAYLWLLHAMQALSRKFIALPEEQISQELQGYINKWNNLYLIFNEWRTILRMPYQMEMPRTERTALQHWVRVARAEAYQREVDKAKLASTNPRESDDTRSKKEKKTKQKPSVNIIEVTSFGLRFSVTPLDVSNNLRTIRDRVGDSWIYTSATISTNQEFTHFKRRMGLDRSVASFSWRSPFNYWEQGCFYVPDHLIPRNNTEEHTHRVVQETWPLIKAANGRTFLLCTSLAAVDVAAQELEDRVEAEGLPYKILVQGQAPRSVLIDEFRRDGNAILVGSKSFWEGVDVRGDALSLVIIDKLPFAPMGDPFVMARNQYVQDVYGDSFMFQTLPDAIITLKQGVGRLIRSETDRGLLVICDSRIAQRQYGAMVVKSLPDFYCTQDPRVAQEFFLGLENFKKYLYH